MVQLEGGRLQQQVTWTIYTVVWLTAQPSKTFIRIKRTSYHRSKRKRMLQEAVDALIDNGRRGRPVIGPGKSSIEIIKPHA